MKNHEHLGSADLYYPKASLVEVGPHVNFIYIMRKDGRATMSPIATRVAHDYAIDERNAASILEEAYDRFFAELADTVLWANSDKGNIQLHLYNAEDLEEQVRIKAGDAPIISLDPLLEKGVFSLRVSRGFYMGGIVDNGQVTRPGFSALELQAEEIASILGKTSAVVVEDDIFSGGSVIRALTSLMEAGVQIKKTTPGIQIGKPTKLEQLGIAVDPVITYKTTDGSDIFDKVDLGDPRDFLLGASGLVIKLGSGEFVRAPYILPFVSTSARASIPKGKDRAFGEKILHANVNFFKKVEEQLGKPLLLKHMDVHFMSLLYSMFGIDHNTPMDMVSQWAMENLQSIWAFNQSYGELHRDIEKMDLPKKLIFLDVNGTLFPDDSTDGAVHAEAVEALKEKIEDLKTHGIRVGLCSDSPLGAMKTLATQLGIHGPIIAENGCILAYSGACIKLYSLEDINLYRSKIQTEAAKLGYVEVNERLSVEFGGVQPAYQDGQWAFGAGREATVSLFGPSQLVSNLGKIFQSNVRYSVDCSPEYNYFSLHPGKFTDNKGKALALLSHFQHTVMLIGNSMSDWVEPSTGVACAYVAGSRITDEVSSQAAYVATKSLMEGVIEILSKISPGGSL